MAENGNGNYHPITLPVLLGVGGLAIGIGGSVIFVGSSLRQIDVNTGRLTALETQGSPTVQGVKADLQSLHVTVNEVARNADKSAENNVVQAQQIATLQAYLDQHKLMFDMISKDLRPREFWEKLAGSISTLDAQTKDLTEARNQGVVQWAMVVQRVAALETRINADEDAIHNLRDRVTHHEQDDIDVLRGRSRGGLASGLPPER